MFQRHVITPEYPPKCGGVSGYVHSLAGELAAHGEEVHIWCPPDSSGTLKDPDVLVHAARNWFNMSGLGRLGSELNRFPRPRHLLVQWVPHGYGWRSMNFAFCLWLFFRRMAYADNVQIMVHEPFLSFKAGHWRQNLAAAVHRLMTVVLLSSAQKVWVSIPEWARLWRPYALGRSVPFEWSPIPSNIQLRGEISSIEAVRRQYAPAGQVIIGHFGTFSAPVVAILAPVLQALRARRGDVVVVLFGNGSKEFKDRLAAKHPEISEYIAATGSLSSEDVSTHISACDLLVQPYPDGVSSRRTSIMAGLAHSKAVVTTSGRDTEALWFQQEGVVLAPDVGGIVDATDRLCSDAAERSRLGVAARELYSVHFDVAVAAAAFTQAEAKRRCAF